MLKDFIKTFFSRKKIEIFVSAILLIANVILAAIFVKLYLLFLVLGLVLLFFISSRLGLFKDFELKETITKYNTNIQKAIYEISLLLNMTHTSVIISSGSLNEEIWGNSEILSVLKSLVEKKKSISIVACAKLNVTKDGTLYEFLKANIEAGCINFYSLEEPPNAHFLVIDDSSVRLEEMHPPEMHERKAIIKIHRFSLAGRARNKFERLLIGAKIITNQNFNTLTFKPNID
jgi:hypothetical protein